MQEITIIFQAPLTKKLKYARKILYQKYTLDTIAVNLVRKNAYITNALVNF